MAKANIHAVRSGIQQVAGFDIATADSGVTLSGAFNQTATSNSAGTDMGVLGVLGHTTGKWQLEFVCGTSWSGSDTALGVCKSGTTGANYGFNGAQFGIGLFPSGNIWANNSNLGASGIGGPVANSVVGFCVDLSTKHSWFTLDGTHWSVNNAVGNPANDVQSQTGGWTIGDLVKPAMCFKVASTTCKLRVRRSEITYALQSGFLPWQSD